MNVFSRISILILSKLFYNLLLIYENIVLKYMECDYIRENWWFWKNRFSIDLQIKLVYENVGMLVKVIHFYKWTFIFIFWPLESTFSKISHE